MKKIFSLLITTLLLSAIACDFDTQPTENSNPDKGSIIINLSGNNMSQSAYSISRSIIPDIEMEIYTYDISGIGTDGATFKKIGISGATQSVTIDNLKLGSWAIRVIGINSNNVVILNGTTTTEVLQRKKSSAHVVMRPVEGKGILMLSVSWPSGVITNPSLTGTLTLNDGSETAMNFSLAGDHLSGSYANADIPAGYHLLSLSLKFGKNQVWGIVEAVRIIEGSETSASFSLDSNNINVPTGNIDITIDTDPQNPISIVLDGYQEQMKKGSTMTVSATTSESVDSYQWYLNGNKLIGETASSITIGSSLGHGNYNLNVIIKKGTIISSEGISFEVEELVTCEGYYTITNETELNNISNCTVITGSLIIENTSLTNIDGLSNITSVGGYVQISNNASLTNIDGLSNLTSVEVDLNIYNNASLTNIDALSNITSVGEDLYIYNNASLTNIDGLSNITSVGVDLYISNNASLTNIDALSNITSVGGALKIDNNASLTNIDALSNITSVGGGLSISYNKFLTNIDGLSKLTSLGGYIQISNNTSLTNIDGLSNITSVRSSLSFYNNAALTNIDGLSNIRSVGEYLHISSNPSLTNIDGLSKLTSVGGYLQISGNASLTNIDGLSNITSVKRHLFIINNASLINIDGLSNITSVGWYLEINNNASLINIDGLSNITSVEWYLYISNNASLANIDGLRNLTTIKGLNKYKSEYYIYITSNDKVLNDVEKAFIDRFQLRSHLDGTSYY
jgi:hypothetical protein